MQELSRMVSEHPLAVTGIVLAALVILYFIASKIIKLALIAILVVIGAWGYFQFQESGPRSTGFRGAFERIGDGLDSLVEKGKRAFEGGRELVLTGREGVGKGRELLVKGRDVLEQGIDKGKETVVRGKETAADLGRRLGGEKQANP